MSLCLSLFVCVSDFVYFCVFFVSLLPRLYDWASVHMTLCLSLCLCVSGFVICVFVCMFSLSLSHRVCGTECLFACLCACLCVLECFTLCFVCVLVFVSCVYFSLSLPPCVFDWSSGWMSLCMSLCLRVFHFIFSCVSFFVDVFFLSPTVSVWPSVFLHISMPVFLSSSVGLYVFLSLPPCVFGWSSVCM